MNVYDFDGTIYKGDSSIDFFNYCVRKHPKVLLAFPKQASAYIRHKLRVINKTKMKEEFYTFFKYIPDIDKTLEEFWDEHQKNIFDWYKEQHEETDIIISASPEFHLKPICDRLGIKEVIASRIDKNTGKCEGLNCRGPEKVTRFNELHGGETIDKFYSDSNSDKYVAMLALRAYFVKRGKPIDWEV